MSHGNRKSIKYTGASSGDKIVGLEKRNRDMILRLADGQSQESGRWPRGEVEVLEAGKGDYARFLQEFVAQTWDARELHDVILQRVNAENQILGRKPLANLTVFDLNSLGVVD
jgi:hypothetical protein